MHLKRIELHGFKSFAGNTVLEFDKGITCVVGPNGSGKSNIADAVRWVLGEQSAKQLRGSKMLDVIFSGTQYRRSVGYTEVSLVIDNEDQSLPIEYTEVVITRKLYRNGDSEYSINNNSCRLKDITGLFLDTGIGKEGYSIIGQGKIQEILSAKSEDRRGIFEEAVGIMKYKVKKLEAQRKLERVEENLVRLGDIIGELKNQISPLQEQSEVAKEYLKIRDRLKILEVGLYLNNLNNYKKRVIKYSEDIKMYQEAIINENAKLNTLSDTNISRNNKIRELEKQEEQKRQQLNEYIMSVETTLHEISIAKERVVSIDANIIRSKNDINEIENKLKLLDSDYVKREERIKYYKIQYEKLSAQLNEKQNELNKILQSLGQRENEIAKLKNMIITDQEKISDIKILVRTLENENISISSNIINYDKEIQMEFLEKDKMLIEKEEVEKHYNNLIRQKVTKEKEHGELLKASLSNQEIRNKKRKALENSRTKLGILESNFKIVVDMEKKMEGYRHSVKRILEETKKEDSSLKGIYNIFGKLISVDEKYEVAIEAALGGNIQNIVVKDEKAAKGAIEFLKKKNEGRATFMPLNSIRKNIINQSTYSNISSFKGVINTADKLVTYESKYENAVLNLLGKIVIVETFDDATMISRKIKGDYKIVTLEGEFFNIGGTITGGSLGRKSNRILGREKEIMNLEKDIQKERENITTLKNELIILQEEQETLSTKISELENSINEINEETIRRESSLYKNNSDLEKIINKLEKLKALKAESIKKRDDNLIIINKKKEEQEKIEISISKLRTKIAEFELSHIDERKKQDELRAYISDLRVSVNSAADSITNTNDTLSRLESERNEAIKKREVIKIDIVENEKKRKILHDEILIKGKIVQNPKEKENNLKDELNYFIKARKEFEEENSSHMDKVSNINKNIIDIQNKISKIEVSKAKVESEMEAMQNRMWDEYGLTHNEALEKHNEIENITEARREIKAGKNRINELGPININAIEDFKKTNERYVFLTEQCEDLEKSKKSLYKVINEMNSVMRKVFVEKFEIINKTFDRVFRELFEGGRAKIVLCDTEDVLESGIDIIVQPPGKKLQNMMLLSGGEKAFTAIALLFAILEMNPSPFCIFDEVEAALDDANVIRYAEYINAYKEKTQFILITHRKGSMEHSDSIYGVTMQEQGVSKVVSMKMTE